MKSWLLLLFCMMASMAHAVTEIHFWHSMTGDLGETLDRFVDDFNESQQQYVIKPIYKGDYISALTSFAAAFQAQQPPDVMQVFEVGTTTMLTPHGIIKPVEQLLQEHGKKLPKNDFFPAVREFYSEKGQLQALPFNTSIPVIFYNADLVAQAGYDAEHFPKTWDELEVLAKKLRKLGRSCVYTSAFPAWIQVEAFAALHGLQSTNSSPEQVEHHHQALVKQLTRLKHWQQQHYFEYGGRGDDPTVLFTSGRCALFSQSSGGYQGLMKQLPFRLGVAALPLDETISAHRYANVVGGAALWVIEGRSPRVYAGIAAFFEYWMQPQIQQRWYQQTGYLPLGLHGVYQQNSQLIKQATLQIAERDLSEQSFDSDGKNTVQNPQRGPLNFLRMINDEALEAIFAGIKLPEQAVNDVEVRSNYAVLRFKQNTGWG